MQSEESGPIAHDSLDIYSSYVFNALTEYQIPEISILNQ